MVRQGCSDSEGRERARKLLKRSMVVAGWKQWKPDKGDREEGWRKVDVVVVDLLLLFATVSESQIESGGGRERGKEEPALSLSLCSQRP